MTMTAPPIDMPRTQQDGNAQTHPQSYVEGVRAYLLSLRSGQKPDIRPDFGPLENVIQEAEHGFNELKPEQRVSLMPKVIKGVCGMKKFQKHNLEGLLAGSDVEQRSTFVQDQEEAIMPPLPESVQLPPAVVALAQSGSPWFDQAVEYCSNASPESPRCFCEGVTVFVLSTGAAGRIVIPGGPCGEHTGFDLALVSVPGRDAKTTVSQAGLNILRSAGHSWLLRPDEITPQKLLADSSGRYPPSNYLQLSPELQEYWKLRLAMAGQGGWYHDELGAFFRSMNRPNSPMADFRGFLLKVDSRIPDYSYATKSWGHERIEFPYLAVLGSTTFADFRTVGKVGGDDWHDGMLSRFTPLVPPPGPALNRPFDFETVTVPASLSIGLHNMHEWLGYPVIDIVEEVNEKSKETKLVIEIVKERPPAREIRPEPEVAAYYQHYRAALRTMKNVPEDLASSYVRLPVKALRVAALFAGIECSSTIHLRHWAKAQELAERWRMSLHLFYQQINASRSPTINTLESKILAYIEQHPGIKARDVYQNLNIDAEIAKKVLFNLVQSGDIVESSVQAANSRMVKLYSRAGGSAK